MDSNTINKMFVALHKLQGGSPTKIEARSLPGVDVANGALITSLEGVPVIQNTTLPANVLRVHKPDGTTLDVVY